MGRQKKYRIKEILERLLEKRGSEQLMTDLKKSFKPFRKDIRSATAFSRWLDNVQSRFYRYGANAKRVEYLKEEEALLESLKKLEGFVLYNTELDFSTSDLHIALAEYVLFKAISRKYVYLGVSHQFKEYSSGRSTDEGEMVDVGYIAINIEPGASRNDLLDYIKENWKNFSEYIGKSRIRETIYRERDFLIYEMRNRGLSYKQIQQELWEQDMGDLDIIHLRSIVRKIKNKKRALQ